MVCSLWESSERDGEGGFVWKARTRVREFGCEKNTCIKETKKMCEGKSGEAMDVKGIYCERETGTLTTRSKVREFGCKKKT